MPGSGTVKKTKKAFNALGIVWRNALTSQDAQLPSREENSKPSVGTESHRNPLESGGAPDNTARGIYC